jgi:hypothetical protein
MKLSKASLVLILAGTCSMASAFAGKAAVNSVATRHAVGPLIAKPFQAVSARHAVGPLIAKPFQAVSARHAVGPLIAKPFQAVSARHVVDERKKPVEVKSDATDLNQK